MTRKQHTIIVVPHARARFRQFQVTSRLLWSVATAVSLSLVLGVVFGVLWIQSVRKNREVSSLVAENQDLRGRTKALNAKLESLEKLLADFEERTRRLSIVAGLSGSPDPGTGGVGGLTALPADDALHTEAVLEEASRRGLFLSGRLGEVADFVRGVDVETGVHVAGRDLAGRGGELLEGPRHARRSPRA